jgi:hypothetical protein
MPRIAVPNPFSGKMEDTESFINSCRLYIETRSLEFADDRTKVFWVLSFMQEGAVREWRDDVLQQLKDGDEPFADIDGFWSKLEDEFGDPDKQSTKVFRLRTIQQGENTADEHVQSFKKIARGSGYFGIALVQEFKRSLNRPLREKISNAEIPPTTIEQWYAKAMRMDRQWRQVKAEERLYASGGTREKTTATKNTGAASAANSTSIPKPSNFRFGQSGSKPIMIGQGASTGPRDPNAMEVDRSQKGPLICYKCRGHGHIARDCKSRMDVRAMDYAQIMEYAKEELEKKGFGNGDE